MEVNGYHQLSGYHHSTKYQILCITEEKRILVWNNLRVRKGQYLFLSELSVKTLIKPTVSPSPALLPLCNICSASDTNQHNKNEF